jgi:hypothetical protein
MEDTITDDIVAEDIQQETENTEQEQVAENTEPEPLPWENAPENTIYYEKLYEDGHLGSFTESPELAYKFGWYDNRISVDDVKVSDKNGWTYLKDKCPMKSESELQIEIYQREIKEWKEYLNSTDYEAIKYAEGRLTDDEYADYSVERQKARNRINELERLINANL